MEGATVQAANQERRGTHRVKVCGTAVLTFDGRVVPCCLTDLSNGGIGVRSAEFGGLHNVRIGDEVHVDLQHERRGGRRVSYQGTIRHVDPSAGRAGIAFAENSAGWQDPFPDDTSPRPPQLRLVTQADVLPASPRRGQLRSIRLDEELR